MTKPSIRVESDPPIVTLVIDRPEVRNALDRAASTELARALRAFDADAETRVAVLTGASGAFCAGADLRELAQGELYEPWAASLEGPTGSILSKPDRPLAEALRREAERSREAREQNARGGAARFVAGEGRHGA